MANGSATNPKLRWAILAAGIADLGSHATLVAAQQQAVTPTDDDAAIEEVVVTGTRIRSPGLIANSPISSVDEDELNFRQPASAEDFIRELPAAVPVLGPGTNNGSPGGPTVNLRGLGSNRNLLLINSRRIVPFNLEGQVDTNVIPIALLERADLVTGGASAVYGADAISGVINFVLREDFEGVLLNTQYGSSGERDAEEYRVDLTLGANVADGRGNVTFSVGRTDQDSLLMGERSLGQFSLSSATGDPSGSSAGVPTFSVLPIGEDGTNVLAQLDPQQGQFSTDPLELYNFNPTNFYRGALERTQMIALGRFEIAPIA